MPGDGLEELVRKSAAGDREAQSALVVRVERPVREAIRRRLPSALRRRVDTDDVFQQTMTEAIAEIGSVEWLGERAFVGWILQIADRRVVDATRRHGAGRRDVHREARLTAAAGVPVRGTSPTQAAVRAEATGALRTAVSRLPESERRVIELRSVEGLTFAEIASRMGLADRYVARHLYDAAVKRLGRLVDARD